MKIGIDFGSTYSTFSKYTKETDTVEALHLAEGAPVSIPSAVSLSKSGTIAVGEAAKSLTGNRSYTVFDGFKMLLVESDKRIIAAKNYNDKYTPVAVTRCYLERILKGILERFGKENEIIEDIYICIPEIWGSKFFSLDGRSILVNILKNLNVPIRKEGIKVVSEPEAASAYFAHNYEKETKKSFNGHLLLIDYGGGTLDITLTEVTSDGNGKMEISYREGCGIGENHPDETGNISLGNAGLAYLQQVLILALEEHGINNINCSEVKFKKALVGFENYLTSIGGVQMIRTTFDMYNGYNDFDELFDEEPEEFFCLDYGDEPVTITYHNILRAYKQIVEPILNSQIRYINDKVARHIQRDPTRPESGNRDDFKIALVGGFGSFYLVQKQISEIYNITSNSQNDMRLKNIRTDRSEQAISLGAALLAAGRVNLQSTARFSIGLLSRRAGEAKPKLTFGIKYHQELVPGRPYFLCYEGAPDDSPKNRLIFTSLRNNIDVFAFGFSENYNKFFRLKLKDAISRRLANIPIEDLWHIGFSVDANLIVSVHIVPFNGAGGTKKGMDITLASYSDMFDLSTVVEEDINEL